MFVKLNFTVNKDFRHCMQLANAIINNTNINSVAALASAAAGYNATVMAGFDFTNSEIIRTVEPTTVKSHYSKTGATTTNISWAMQFPVYDASDRSYYILFDSSATQSSIRVGDTIASGSMTGDQYDMSLDSGTATAANDSGIPVKLSAVAPAQRLDPGPSAVINTSAPNNFGNIRCFWMYLNNDCLIVAWTTEASSNLGFNATYNSALAYNGPWIFSQYNRYDYHNTDANGVIPVMFTNISRPVKGNGFGGLSTAPDWARAENVNFGFGAAASGQTDTAFRVFNFIDAHPQVGTSWPLVPFPLVNWGSGSRDTQAAPLTTKSALDLVTATTVQVPRLIHTTAQTRYPSTDLRTVGYGMLPLRWRNSYRFNQGGNATDRGGFYIFNGEYFPGDTFVHSGKTYMIWPTYLGYTDRVGVAVPKE